MFDRPPTPERKSLRAQLLDSICKQGMNEKTIEVYSQWELERQQELRAADRTSGAQIRLELERAQLFFDAGMREEADVAYNDALTIAENEGLEHIISEFHT